MVNYGNGKIYRIIDNITNDIYIGSTCVGLSQRLANHRRVFECWKRSGEKFTSSFPILERGDYQIVLIEEYPCATREQLCSRERYWIEQYPECINKIRRPITTVEEKQEQNRKWCRQNGVP